MKRKNKIVKIPKRPGEPDCTFADISKILKKTKWKPKISFKDGINKLLKSIDEFKDAPVWDAKSIENETNIQGFLGNSQDYQEGLKAVFEKRKPVFQGK